MTYCTFVETYVTVFFTPPSVIKKTPCVKNGRRDIALSERLEAASRVQDRK